MSSELLSISQPSTMTLKTEILGPAPASKDDQAQSQPVVRAEEPTGPYFYYRDQSHLADPDPSMPVTIPGRIPTFPAKLFAILSRPDLADIISWMPHGRSWKVHKPREFEVKVIPTYFDHAKFSSFIRQANGWGFKRVCTKGTDRNSHYHELFLRGLPHLIKFMRRPVSGSKVGTLPQQQHIKDKICDPDFYKISEDHPLPEFTPKMLHPLDESSFLNSAKNRMLDRPTTNTDPPQGHRPQGEFMNSFEVSTDRMSLYRPCLSFQDSSSSESFHLPTPILNQNQHQSSSFLLPRVSEVHPQVVTSCADSIHLQPLAFADQHCIVRQEERELDPLTILMNDVYEGAAEIDDPIIQSLISDSIVAPPSSLGLINKPSPSVYDSTSNTTFGQYMSGLPALVSPVYEAKIIQNPEPDQVDTDPLSAEAHLGGMMFEDPFQGGLLAKDFF